MKKVRFVYKADGKRISDVLRDFAAAQGVPVVVDPKIEGLVSGSFDASPSDFLEAMTKAYSLIWYYDGTALYMYPASAIQSRSFRLKGYTEEQVLRMLASLKLDSSRYPIRFDRANSIMLVYGPPRHIDLLSMAVESLDATALESTRRIVRVFPLRYASAGDRMLGATRVAGVASTLSAVFGGARNRQGEMMAQAQREARKQAAPLSRALAMPDPDGRNRLLPDLKLNMAASSNEAGQTPRPMKSPLDDDSDGEAPIFEVDDANNAVIVYGKANRMVEISALIQTLDIPAQMVELEATFIEVATDGIKQLGIDWSVATNAASVSTRSGETASTDRAGAGLLTAPFTISTLLRDAGRSLMASVSALEGKGKARIVSKPRVLGLANRPAVMVEKRIANVRVSGNLEANLFQVEAGTMLQITPQVTAGERGKPATIKLSIYIEDGNFEATSVDKVPVLKRTEIRTEARVMEGESLLVGGISVESESGTDAGVPKLKELPFVGGLFRNVSQRSVRVERLFLLTPRVIQSIRDADMVSTQPTRLSESTSVAPAVPTLPLAQAALPAAGPGVPSQAALGSIDTRAPQAAGREQALPPELVSGRVRDPASATPRLGDSVVTSYEGVNAEHARGRSDSRKKKSAGVTRDEPLAIRNP